MPRKSHCQACERPDNNRMVSCCHCRKWWHYDCVGVNDSIAAEDRTFNCPKCQRPTTWVPSTATPHASEMGSAAGSKAGSVKSAKSTSSTKARRAQLELERLAAMKEIALKHLEVEMEQRRLRVEAEVLEATFRVKETEQEDDSDGDSVVTQQSRRSKVEKWQRQQQQYVDVHSTIIESTDRVIQPSTSGSTTAAVVQPGQGGKQQPLGPDARPSTGILPHESGLGQTLGGIVDRTSSIVIPAGYLQPLGVLHGLSPPIVPLQTFSPALGVQREPIPAASKPVANEISLSHGLYRSKVTAYVPFVSSLIGGLGAAGVSGLESGVEVSLGTQLRPLRPAPPSPVPGRQAPVPTVPPAPMPHPSILGQAPMHHPLIQGTQPELYPPTLIPQHQFPVTQVPDVGQPAWEGPTRLQIQSRHVMPKELPAFDGKPEEWPIFISAYHNSTTACGYSNLSRLEKCLKGDARTHVESLLRIPEGVPHILALLEQVYGRPEQLIYALTNRIRETAAPKEDEPDTLVKFGLAVQNLCNHIIAAKQEAHLNNPELLMNLVGKLPGNWLMDWSLYQERCATVNLLTFAQYMQVLVRAGVNASLYRQTTPTQPQTANQTTEKSTKKNFCCPHSTSVVHTQASTTPVKEEVLAGSSRPSGLACLVCKNVKHRVKDCPEFAEEDTDGRWRLVQRLGLCRLCLGAHSKRPCLARKQCDVDGCQQRHHPLLHDVVNEKTTDKQTQEASASGVVSNHHFAWGATNFRIIPVTLYGKDRSVVVHAFLDDGSSKTLIDEEVVKQLGLEGKAQSLCLQWTSNFKRTEAKSRRVDLEITGLSNTDKFKLTDVRTVSKLDLPQQSLRFAELADQFPYLSGLPIEDYEDIIPRILIGNDNAYVSATLQIRDRCPGEPIAARTRLGWTVYGFNQDGSADIVHNLHISECCPTAHFHREAMIERRRCPSVVLTRVGVCDPTAIEDTSTNTSRVARRTKKQKRKVGVGKADLKVISKTNQLYGSGMFLNM